MKKRIYVTEPSLPPLDQFTQELKKIWETKWLTNNGDFHNKFERELETFLNVKHCSLVSNGTLGLLIALKALRINGEVITTPYSFVASTHALFWNGIKPIFCDIEPNTFNINPDKIESLITPNTTAIMPVHVYGNPCDFIKIREIADRHGLKVIYDAAHAFNVKANNESILNYGDISVLSFHATKVFNTIEGGAIVTDDINLKQRIDYLKNFGFADEVTVVGPGINAKLNEVQAAFGRIQLKHVENGIKKRKRVAEIYRKLLSNLEWIEIFNDLQGVDHNYSYFPVLIKNEHGLYQRDDLYEYLKNENIYTRRYFYPLISDFPMYQSFPSANPSNLQVAVQISKEILCLPIYENLEEDDIYYIVDKMKNWKRSNI